MAFERVPSLVFLPATLKTPPFLHYSALVKVFPLMEWIRENAHYKFDWGELLPQFDKDEKHLFKEQIKQREEGTKSNEL
jgi:hypothetical protein